jgi:chorismate synthase
MSLRFLTSGESHGPALIAILDGIPAGLTLDAGVINIELRRRLQGKGSGPRASLEADKAVILGGVLSGLTTGAPIGIMIDNSDHHNWRGKKIPSQTIPRPGHADLTGALKFGYRDLRIASERASARETAARVAAGAVCKHLLKQFNIHIMGYVTAIGNIIANLTDISANTILSQSLISDVCCPDLVASKEMEKIIDKAKEDGDTLGGIIEVVAIGIPPGLGSFTQWDQRLDAQLGAVILSIPAIKGIEFGPAFENSRIVGTEVQDSIFLSGSKLIRASNRSGGLEGGITTGDPLVVRAAMKPIASTRTPNDSVDLAIGRESKTRYERSDICPVPRAVPIVEAMVAFCLASSLLGKLGGDSIDELLPRYATLRQPRLSDLPMDHTGHVFWPK